MRELLESEILNYLCGPQGGSLWLGGSSHTWLRSPSYQLAAGGARAVRAVQAGVLTLAPAVCLAAPACASFFLLDELKHGVSPCFLPVCIACQACPGGSKARLTLDTHPHTQQNPSLAHSRSCAGALCRQALTDPALWTANVSLASCCLHFTGQLFQAILTFLQPLIVTLRRHPQLLVRSKKK